MAPTIAPSSSSPSGESGARRVHYAALAFVLVLYAGVTSLGLTRPGYSIDEEITYFAAHGIAAHGVPRLPSGALENRGLPFTYAAWLSGVVFGQSLPAYRVPSLIAGVLTIALVFRVASIALPPAAAVVVAAAVAILPWQIIGGQWARFYSMFLACVLWSLLLFWRHVTTGRSLGVWLASVAVAHLLHDFAIALVLLPAALWLLAPADLRTRPSPPRLVLAALGAFVASEALLFTFHLVASAPPFRTALAYALLHAPVTWQTGRIAAEASVTEPLQTIVARVDVGNIAIAGLIAVAGAIAGVMLTRVVRASPALGAAGGAVGAAAQFGRVWFLTVVWAFSRPAQAVATMTWGVIAIALSTLVFTLSRYWLNGTAFTLPFVKGVGAFALQQFTAVYAGLAAFYPLTTAALFASGVLLAVRYTLGPLTFPRLLFAWVLWWLLLFDVLGIEFKPRYWVALWPLVVAAIMHGPAALSDLRGEMRRLGALAAALMLLMAGVTVWEQYRADDENRTARCVMGDAICVPAMVHYETAGMTEAARAIRPTDTVFCGDELACDLTVGRADYWLYSGAIFSYPSERGPIGLYGGAPIVASLAEFTERLQRRGDDARFWIVLPTLRKYSNWTVEDVLNAVPEPLRGRLRIQRSPGGVVIGPSEANSP